MVGLMVVGVGFLYLILWIGAVVWAHRWATRRGYSKSKAIGMGFAAFLVMYLIPFWDHIPTLVAHKYYCEKEAGFWIYKTLDQWKAENPGVMEKLITGQGEIKRMPYGDLQTLDERFAIETRRRIPVTLLSMKIFEDLLVDRKTSEVLARGIDVGSGYGNLAIGADSWQEYKFWLRQKPCITYGISSLSTEIQNMRGKK